MGRDSSYFLARGAAPDGGGVKKEDEGGAKKGDSGESNPGPAAPKAAIIPLDHYPESIPRTGKNSPMYCEVGGAANLWA